MVILNINGKLIYSTIYQLKEIQFYHKDRKMIKIKHWANFRPKRDDIPIIIITQFTRLK